MSWIFGKQDDKGQRQRENKELRVATRELATDLRQLERKEKELEQQIKSLARAGHKEACTLLAKQLVQLRRQKTKNIQTGANVSAISSKSRQARSMETMGKAMATTAQTLKSVNDRMPVQQTMRDMEEFGRQQAMMDMRGEMMEETLDAMLEGDEAEEERVIDQVLDEIGIETKELLSKAPKVGPKIREGRGAEVSDKTLEQMMTQLRD